jgi:hypothetical protein
LLRGNAAVEQLTPDSPFATLWENQEFEQMPCGHCSTAAFSFVSPVNIQSIFICDFEDSEVDYTIITDS